MICSIQLGYCMMRQRYIRCLRGAWIKQLADTPHAPPVCEENLPTQWHKSTDPFTHVVQSRVLLMEIDEVINARSALWIVSSWNAFLGNLEGGEMKRNPEMGETVTQPLPAKTADSSISGLHFISPLCRNIVAGCKGWSFSTWIRGKYHSSNLLYLESNWVRSYTRTCCDLALNCRRTIGLHFVIAAGKLTTPSSNKQEKKIATLAPN